MVTLGIILIALLLVIDQVTKALVVHYIHLGDKITIIPHLFYLTHVTNRGAAWGILQGYGWLLLLVALLASLLIIVKLRWLTEGWGERYFAVFIILSGIIGNSVDRIWRHEVIDFLDFIVWPVHGNHGWQLGSWPAFNVADSAICVGVGIYFISLLLRPEKEKKTTVGDEKN